MTLQVSRPVDDVDGRKEAELVVSLLAISKSTRALTGLKLGELGFHNGQDELLFALDEKTEVSVSKLAEDLCVRASTVSKMLDRLVAAGLAVRALDIKDARRTMIRLTPAGSEARGRLRTMRGRLEVELKSSLPDNGSDMLETLEEVAALLAGRLRRLR